MREPLLRGTSGRLAPRFFICSYEKKTINFHQEPDGECNLNIWPMKRLFLLILGFICWQGVVQAKNYFYVTALEDSVDISWQKCDIQISHDGVNWIESTDSSGSVVIENAGDTLFFKGHNPNGFPIDESDIHGTIDWGTGVWSDSVKFVFFSKQKRFSVGGNLLSLVTPEWNDSTVTPIFRSFFSISSVVDASRLELSKNLSEGCYSYMFSACQELVSAPKLPATELSPFCYMSMFSYCSSLEKAPDLPARNLLVGCYNSMFSNCSRLNYVNVSFERFPAPDKDNYYGFGTYPTGFWMPHNASKGVFVAKNMDCTNYGKESKEDSDEFDYAYIPNGWTFICKGYDEPEDEFLYLYSKCDTTINGIYYKLNRESKTAEVTCRKDTLSPQYSGVLEIPETIDVNDTTYTVTSISKYAFYASLKSNGDSVVLEEVRLPKTILDIHTPFCCLPVPPLPEHDASMPDLVRQKDSIDGKTSSISSKTNIKKIVVSNKSSLKFICRDIGAAILERLYFNDNKVDAKMVLEEMTGSRSFTSLKLSVDSMLLIRETFEWIYNRNWWGQIESLAVTEGTKLDDIPSSIYNGVLNAKLKLLLIPCSYKSKADWSNAGNLGFGSIDYEIVYADVKKDSEEFVFSLCDTNLDLGYSFNDTLYYHGTLENWCVSPFYNLQYSTLFIDGKEVSGNLVIPEGVDSIAAGAFSKCSKLTSITLPKSLTYIGENVFAGCTRVRSVTCYSPYPPEAFDNSFANYNSYLYMPCDYFDEYDLHVSWGSFKHIECSSAEQADVEDLQINPDYDNAEFAWPTTSGTHVYSLQIKKDDELVCTLNFNEDGQLANIDFGGASSNSRLRSASLGYRFTVTGLQENTNYSFSLEAKDENEKLLKHYEGDFKTKSIDGSEGESSNVSEIERFRLFEVKGDILVFECDSQIEVFDLVGRCLYRNVGNGTFKVPAGGIYLVRIGGKGFKVEVD